MSLFHRRWQKCKDMQKACELYHWCTQTALSDHVWQCFRGLKQAGQILSKWQQRDSFLKKKNKKNSTLTALLTALIIVSADCDSGLSDFLAALHIFGQTEGMLTRLELPPSTSRRALPLISSSCAHRPQAAALWSAEPGRAEPQLPAHGPVTSVQDTPAASASFSISRHHTHKGIAATTSNVTKLRRSTPAVFQMGIFIFLLCRSSWHGCFLTFCEHLTGPTQSNPLRKPITYRF